MEEISGQIVCGGPFVVRFVRRRLDYTTVVVNVSTGPGNNKLEQQKVRPGHVEKRSKIYDMCSLGRGEPRDRVPLAEEWQINVACHAVAESMPEPSGYSN